MFRIQSFADVGYRPGLIGRLAAMQAEHYAPRYQFGIAYEADTAAELSHFLEQFDPVRDALWVVTRDGVPLGSAAIDGRGGQAQLRWVFLADELRGRGLGRALLTRALDFCALAGYDRIELVTHARMEAAIRLYERAGFELAGEERAFLWGRWLSARRYALSLPSAPAAARTLAVPA